MVAATPLTVTTAVKQEFGFRVSDFRRFRSTAMLATIWGFSLAAIIPLLFVFYFVTSKGVGGLNWDFFTALPAPVGQ